MGECALVMVEFGGKQNRLRGAVLKGPPRHPKNGRRHATPGDFVGIPGVPGFSRGQAGLALRIGKDFGCVTELFNLFDDPPFEPIEILGQPRIGRQANVYSASNSHKILGRITAANYSGLISTLRNFTTPAEY